MAKKKDSNEARHRKMCRRLIAIRDQISKLYDDCHHIEEMLLAEKFKGNELAILVDNFKTKNVCYRTTSVRRFEIKTK